MEKIGKVPKEYRVLITGSSGMLGVDLCAELEDSYEVCGMDIAENPNSRIGDFYRGDITDRDAIVEIFLKAKPHFAVHTAAWTDVDGCELDAKKAYEVNAGGSENVALACEASGAVLIYISTDFVFDGRSRKPYKEEDGPGAVNIYGDSKLKGEEAIGKVLKKYFILRTSWLYGRHGKNFVDTVLDKAGKEKILKIVNDQVGSPTYSKDLAAAIHVLLDRVSLKQSPKDYGIYHVSNSGSVSWYEYTKEIMRLKMKSVAEIVPISSGELVRPAKRPAMSVLDNSKFTKFTGYRMRNWKEALKAYLS